MPGVTSANFSADDGAYVCRLRGRADKAIDADVARLRGALGDQFGAP